MKLRVSCVRIPQGEIKINDGQLDPNGEKRDNVPLESDGSSWD